jgi:hypothetical protein
MMGNQFNYELDERKIRILMKDAEINYNEALWQKFDELAISKSKSNYKISNYIPTINFGISRSIVIPVIFIVLIGGLSTILFSVIDFKKKESVEKEIPFVVSKVEIKKTINIIKPVIKPKVAIAIPAKIDSIAPAEVIRNASDTTITIDSSKVDSVKNSELNQKTKNIKSTKQKKEATSRSKKKKRKIKPEKLRAINTSNSLNENSGENELKLK